VQPYSPESIVKKMGAIPVEVLGKVMGGVLEGLEYLHCQRKVVHRDIKPGNILMKLSGEPKITDFGISAELGGTQGLLDSFKGTMCYMSPEVGGVQVECS
jgi:serine/threonine protein kinase